MIAATMPSATTIAISARPNASTTATSARPSASIAPPPITARLATSTVTGTAGDRLPPAYRADRYRITNYSYYRLPPPPRGYYYTRVDNDVILTAAATGVIASVIVGMFQ